MNLKTQYKRLFEARVSSNDAKLLRESTWALGSKSQLDQVFKDITKLQDDILSQKKSVSQYISTLKKMSKELYNVVGDDEFMDAIDGALKALHTHKFVKENAELISRKLEAAKNRLADLTRFADPRVEKSYWLILNDPNKWAMEQFGHDMSKLTHGEKREFDNFLELAKKNYKE